MGAYKNSEIDGDFKIATKGFYWPVVDLMLIIAKAILETMPDNQARDLAISHLLQSAEMVSHSWILSNNNSSTINTREN